MSTPGENEDYGRPLSHVVITSNRLSYSGPLPTELLDQIAEIVGRHIAIENLARDPLQAGFTPECSPPPSEPWDPTHEIRDPEDDERWRS